MKGKQKYSLIAKAYLKELDKEGTLMRSNDWFMNLLIAILVLLSVFVVVMIILMLCNSIVLESKTYNAKGTVVEFRHDNKITTTVMPITNIRGGISPMVFPRNEENYISVIKVNEVVYEVDSRNIYYSNLKKGANVDVVMRDKRHPFLGWETSIVKINNVEC